FSDPNANKICKYAANGTLSVFKNNSGYSGKDIAEYFQPGIAFSPDEKYLYVGNWDLEKKVLMRYDVNADATLSNGKVFFDMTKAPGEDAIDGIKVDQEGNLYVSRPR